MGIRFIERQCRSVFGVDPRSLGVWEKAPGERYTVLVPQAQEGVKTAMVWLLRGKQSREATRDEIAELRRAFPGL